MKDEIFLGIQMATATSVQYIHYYLELLIREFGIGKIHALITCCNNSQFHIKTTTLTGNIPKHIKNAAFFQFCTDNAQHKFKGLQRDQPHSYEEKHQTIRA